MVVHSAESGSQALDLLCAGPLHFDAALIDANMPEMDGIQLANLIRQLEQWADLPLILLTSIGAAGATAASGALPGASYKQFAAVLTKPAKSTHLADTLLRILGKEQDALPHLVEPTATNPQADAIRPLRILLAEDNAINQKVALLILNKLGYQADVAADGIEVLDALQRQPYDLILMDVQMPEMDGLEATRQIRKHFAPETQPRIVAMTANAMQGDRAPCLAAGMDDYISKPMRAQDLLAVLNGVSTR
jgi:CheY-like chemotaxis protein